MEESNGSSPSSRGRVNQQQSNKLKVLVRSHAMREEASPPREPLSSPAIKLTLSGECSPGQSPCISPVSTVIAQEEEELIETASKEQTANNNNTIIKCEMLSVATRPRNKLRQQSSSQGSFESNSPCLSRDGSSEHYTDTTGVDLELFIPETLNRNAKDRALMLRIEQDLVNLAKDRMKSHFKFPPMSSYQRMLVHRCAAYFGMDHNIESSGKCVVVNKTKNTRIPDVQFKEHVKEDVIFTDEPLLTTRRSILKRMTNSMDDYSFKSPDRANLENKRSKSFEEREEEYEKARRRIFNREDSSSEELLAWTEIPWSSTESEGSSRLKLPVVTCEGRRRYGKLIKVQSEETSGETLRPCVAKSYSFGGYAGVLNRGDSLISTHSAGPRLLTKQDSSASSVSWRLSPSSSGYKSQSQMSESVTPSPTSTPGNRDDLDSSQIIWAVTDIQDVPKGSVIINPSTGKALKNDDGSLYHYDPNNLPVSLIGGKGRKKSSSAGGKSTSPKKINSATSPITQYSPPGGGCSNNRSFVQSTEGYAGFEPYHEPQAPVFPQPYIVYNAAPFNAQVPQQVPYETRLVENVPLTEVPYYIGDSSPQNNYWNQPPPNYYQPNPPNSMQREFCGYLPGVNQAPNEVVPVFPAPPSGPQMIFPAAISNQPPIVYSSHHGALFQPQQYPPVLPAQPPQNSGYMDANQAQIHHLSQSMQHLNLNFRTKNPKISASNKSFMLGSSQSSTGTNSPAGTVVAAGFCPQNSPAMLYHHRTDTPPSSQFNHHSFSPQQMLFRQISNHSNTPGTTQNSRSPTPASDVAPRMPLPSNLYQGMPYILHHGGRSQPSTYRSNSRKQYYQQNYVSSSNKTRNKNK